MRIEGFIWLRSIIDKIISKHHVSHKEVEEVFSNKPKFRLIEKGHVKKENLYSAQGQTDDGRYLSVLFIHKKTKEALIITARDMDSKERRKYAKK